MSCHHARLFCTDRSAAVLTGTVAGLLAGFNAVLTRHSLPLLFFLLPVVLLLGPAIASRSPLRCLAACGYVALFCNVIAPVIIPIINGRADLPLTVWGALFWATAVPWYDACSWGWPTRAIVDFAVYLAYLNLGITLLRQKQPLDTPLIRRMAATLCTILIIVPLSLILFRLSWGARVSGTFCHPLYTTTQLALSLTVYVAIFPLNTLGTILLRDRLLSLLSSPLTRSGSTPEP